MTHHATRIGLGLLLAGFAGQAAAEMPAVSQTHLELEAAAGFLGEDTLYTGGALIAVPTGDQFGLQFDLLGGYLTEEEPFSQGLEGDEANMYGGGFQGFWRSPNLGKVGLTGAFLSVEDVVDIGRLGITSERYLGPISIMGELGYEYDDITDGGVYAQIGVNAYVADNVKLSLSIYGNSHEYDETFLVVNNAGNTTVETFEFSPEIQAEGMVEAGLWRTDLSLFGVVRGGNEMDFTAQAGLRWEIGSRWKHLRGSDRGDNNPNQMSSIVRASERLIRAGRIVRLQAAQCSIVTEQVQVLVGAGTPLEQITLPVDNQLICPIDDQTGNILSGILPIAP